MENKKKWNRGREEGRINIEEREGAENVMGLWTEEGEDKYGKREGGNEEVRQGK